MEMNYLMYSWWSHGSIGADGTGIHQYGLTMAALNHEIFPHMLQDIKEAVDWAAQRVHGVFYVLCARPDGTVLVSEDGQRVYLVQARVGPPLSVSEAIRE
jgi:hypothetical protein